MKQPKKYYIVTVLIVLMILAGCQTVKPYQRVFLNDYYMKMSNRSIEKTEQNVHTYREGASGGGRGKTSGGCGCN
jgi:hypothetical protein